METEIAEHRRRQGAMALPRTMALQIYRAR